MYPECNQASWVLELAGQVALCVAMIYWTAEVQHVLSLQQSQSLTEYYERLQVSVAIVRAVFLPGTDDYLYGLLNLHKYKLGLFFPLILHLKNCKVMLVMHTKLTDSQFVSLETVCELYVYSPMLLFL